MQQGSNKSRIPAGFPGMLAHQQSSSPMFSPPMYSGATTSLPSQSSTETVLSDHRQSAEVNLARHCRIGQELVHEIVQKSMDVFHVLKTTQLPNHLPTNTLTHNDRKKHTQENLKLVLEYFKQLKYIYAGVKESSDKLPLKHVEELIPFVGDDDVAEGASADANQSDVYKQVSMEHLSLTQQLQAKNMHLKEIIDQLRNLLWEINTMMSVKTTTS